MDFDFPSTTRKVPEVFVPFNFQNDISIENKNQSQF